MIFNAQKLVTHLMLQQVQGTKTCHVHMHMIIFHNNFIPWLTVHSKTHCIQMKWTHHYLLQTQLHSVSLT